MAVRNSESQLNVPLDREYSAQKNNSSLPFEEQLFSSPDAQAREEMRSVLLAQNVRINESSAKSTLPEVTIDAVPAAAETAQCQAGDINVSMKPDGINIKAGNFVDIAESIPGIKLDRPLKTLLSSVKSVGLEGSKIKIEGQAIIPLEPGGGLPTVQLKLDNATFDIVPDGNNPTKIALINIKGLSISALGAGGDIDQISLKLDRNSDKKPILKIDIPAPVATKTQGSDALQRLSQNWKQLANSVMPPVIKLEVPLGSQNDAARFEQVFALAKSCVEAQRKDDAYIKMIEAASGTKLEQPFKDMVSGISSFSKEGDRIHITRAKRTSHDLGGVTLDVSRNVSFKVSDDKNGINVSDIRGIGVTVPVELPSALKALGIDPGDKLSTSLKDIFVSHADAAGNRKIVVDTNQHLRKVGMRLGPDMQPAKDANGNWYFYGFAHNPLSDKSLPFILRFDRNNKINMSTQELMRLGGQATWQAADRTPGGIGMGVIAIGSEVGAQALDKKDDFVRGCKVIGNTARNVWNWIWD